MKTIFRSINKLQLLRSYTLYIILIGLLLFGLSYLGYIFPWLNLILFFVICFFTILATIRNFEDGLFILFFELFLGSKGYLFSFHIGDFVISLRLAIFIIIFLIWIIRKITSDPEIRFLKSPFLLSFLIFVATLLMGVILGIVNKNKLSIIFFDMNAYLYWGVLIITFDAFRKSKHIEQLLRIFIGTAIAVSLFTLIGFFDFLFFHQDAKPDLAKAISTELSIDQGDEIDPDKISQSTTAKKELTESSFIRTTPTRSIPLIYRWLQDTGLGEVSYISGKFFRVFFISHIFPMLGFLFIWTRLMISYPSQKQQHKLWFAIGILFICVIIISLSRSIWLGTLGGLLYSLLHIPIKRTLKIGAATITLFIIIGVSVKITSPHTFQTWNERALSIVQPTGDKASTNRINLLQPLYSKIQQSPVLGNGFGTTIEYQSITPEKTGMLRVYLVEWAYLDIVLKLGLVGLAAYMWFLTEIIRQGYLLMSRKLHKPKEGGNVIHEIHLLEYNKLKKSRYLVVLSLIIGMISILITNITTPYLNHPLGIGFLIVVAVSISVFNDEHIRITKKYS